MSDPNLNQPVPGTQGAQSAPAAPERFDLHKHVHGEQPFITGFWMLVSVSVMAAALVGSLGGGAYILFGGKVPEFAQQVRKPGEPGGNGGDGSIFDNKSKPLDEAAKVLLTQFAEEWNSGHFPTTPVTEEFHTTGKNGEQLSVSPPGLSSTAEGGDVVRPSSPTANGAYARELHILENLPGKVIQTADNEAKAEVMELSRVETTLDRWYKGANENGGKALWIERGTVYEYGLQRTNGVWKLSSRKLQEGSFNGTRIRQADDGEPDLKIGPVPAAIEDQRLNKEALQPRYDGIAAAFSAFRFPQDVVFREYKHKLSERGGERTARMLQIRLDRAKARIVMMELTAQVEEVTQPGEAIASALVRYRARFKPVASENEYVAIWRDRDTWGRAKGTRNWYLLRTDRTYRSELMEHYER